MTVDRTSSILDLATSMKAAEAPPRIDSAWLTRPLAALVDHVVTTFHAFTRSELPRLRRLATQAQVEDGARPELCAIAALLAEFESEMIPHMVKEERILFPYLIELEARARAGNQRPAAPYGVADNPVRAMMREHHHADDVLRTLRRVASEYVAPRGASPSAAALYEGLAALERALHDHLCFETDVLFRRAIELEGT